jgi:uncharacterized protein YkwD/photosystem II stability/assembly factor-like uncharacterized protein
MTCDNLSRPHSERHEARMPSRFKIGFIIILAAFVLPAVAPGCYAQMLSMKLLTPTTGWVSNDGHLYWTTDRGSHWTDITPIPPNAHGRGVGVLSVYFLNTQEGRVIISYPETIVPLTAKALQTRKTLYDIAQTVDGGQTWSFLPLTYPELPQQAQEALVGPRDMFFLDPLHGWVVMAFAGNSLPGQLLATDDGGRNWKWVNGPAMAGIVQFTFLQHGWLLGLGKLLATRDGGASWQVVKLTPPPQVGAATEATFKGLPVFKYPLHAFTAVYYIGAPGVQPKLVVYATDDGGKTWRPVKVVGEAEESGALTFMPFAITDSLLAISTGTDARHPRVTMIHLSGELSAPTEFSVKGSTQLSFLDGTHGTALSSDGNLLRTSDGGSTWKDVTPWHIFKPTPARPDAQWTKPHVPDSAVALFSEAGASNQGDWQRFGTSRATPASVPARSDPRPTSGTDRMASLAKQMWTLINRDRQDPANAPETGGGARPLKWNEKLAADALAHSRDMLRRRYFAHVDREGRTPKDRFNAAGIEWRALAENIAINRTVTDAENDLMDEPRFQKNHRGNILNPEYTEVGIGIVQAPNGDLYITQDFVAMLPPHGGARSGP